MKTAGVAGGPGDEDELEREAGDEGPVGQVGEAVVRVPEHEEVHVEVNEEHEDDADGGGATGLREQEAEAGGDLGCAGEGDPEARVGVVIRHDGEVGCRMPEVVGSGHGVEEGLCIEPETVPARGLGRIG